MTKITDLESYWNAVDENWEYIEDILYQFLPMDAHKNHQGKPIDRSMGDQIEMLKKEKDQEIVRYFNLAWAIAPDAKWIHSMPKWGLFCDLCSEEWVFQCPHCHGSGQIEESDVITHSMAQDAGLPECEGQATITSRKCDGCGGNGTVG